MSTKPLQSHCKMMVVVPILAILLSTSHVHAERGSGRQGSNESGRTSRHLKMMMMGSKKGIEASNIFNMKGRVHGKGMGKSKSESKGKGAPVEADDDTSLVEALPPTSKGTSKGSSESSESMTETESVIKATGGMPENKSRSPSQRMGMANNVMANMGKGKGKGNGAGDDDMNPGDLAGRFANGSPGIIAGSTANGLIRGSRQAAGDCVLPESGFYGTATSDLAIVSYLYQATLLPGTSLTQLNSVVVPALDRGIAEGILPSFFPCFGRRRLQSSGVTGISSQGQDIPLVGQLPCVGQQGGDCFIFLGEVSAFLNGLTVDEATEDVRLAIQLFIASGAAAELTPFVTRVTFVTEDLQTPAPFPTRVPTPAPGPDTFQPTTTFGPTSDFPTASPAPTDPIMPRPTVVPVSATSFPTPSITRAPVVPSPPLPTLQPFNRPTFSPDGGGGNTFKPTGTPDTPSPPTDPLPSVRQADTGLDKVDWWGWLLAGVGGLMIFLCAMTYLNGARGTPPPKRAGSSSRPEEAANDDYMPPGTDSYSPPGGGLGAFNIEPQPEEELAVDNIGDLGAEDEYYDDGEGEYEDGEGEYEDGEFEGEEEYEDGEFEGDEGEFEGDDYEGEEGDFEEESYYEEETDGSQSNGANAQQQQQQW